MALKKTSGTAKSFDDLIAQLIAWVTDETIHGDDAWNVMRSEPWPRGTILRAHGRRKGEYQYIGLMPNTIVKGETYPKWLFTKPNLATYFVWSPNGLNYPGIDFSVDNLAVTVQGTSYTFENPDISCPPLMSCTWAFLSSMRRGWTGTTSRAASVKITKCFPSNTVSGGIS